MEQIQRKLMTKFFFKFKNPIFGLFLAHFPNFVGKNSFSKISGCHTQLHKGFYTMQKLKKTNDPIPRGYPDRQKDGLKDTRMHKPYLIGPFQLPLPVQQQLQ